MRHSHFLGAFIIILSVGCGPSLRVTHLGSRYFEKCWSDDRNPEVAQSTKRACWASWLEGYQLGQPQPKVRFAKERLQALTGGVLVDPVQTDARSEDLGGTAGKAAPTVSAQNIEAELSGEEAPSTPDDELLAPPNDAATPCTQVCNPRWYRCVRRCEDRGHNCVTACRVEYRSCNHGCF